LGSFSQDPIGFAGGDANLYRMVGNHPTYATDPSGMAETIGEETLPWYNDSWWDYANPYAWTAWVGTPVGTAVGTVLGAASYHDSYWADKEILELRRKYVTENAGSIPLCDYGGAYRLPQSQATAIEGLARIDVEFYGVGTGLATATKDGGVGLPIWVSLPRGPRVIVGGGATTSRISSSLAQFIQEFATRYNVRVTVVGSRVNPNKALTPGCSDWDYLISPLQNSKPVKSMRDINKSGGKYLPRGVSQTDDYGNVRAGCDIETNVPVDPTLPHIIFTP